MAQAKHKGSFSGGALCPSQPPHNSISEEHWTLSLFKANPKPLVERACSQLCPLFRGRKHTRKVIGVVRGAGRAEVRHEP